MRGSVVKCLLKVPMEQFEDEEVGKIMQLLQSCNNVNAGKIEIVLSGIYWIFYRMLANSLKPEEEQVQAGRTLVSKYGGILVQNVLDILQKNLCRISDGTEDDQEKFILTLSIAQLLKIISVSKNLSKQLSWEKH